MSYKLLLLSILSEEKFFKWLQQILNNSSLLVNFSQCHLWFDRITAVHLWLDHSGWMVLTGQLPSFHSHCQRWPGNQLSAGGRRCHTVRSTDHCWDSRSGSGSAHTSARRLWVPEEEVKKLRAAAERNQISFILDLFNFFKHTSGIAVPIISQAFFPIDRK